MSSAWSNAKKARARELSRQNDHDSTHLWICEICLGEGHIGHHINPRENGGLDCANNVEIRCEDCERWAHMTHPDGNPPKDLIDKRREYLRRCDNDYGVLWRSARGNTNAP